MARSFEVLLAEDSPSDAALTREALRMVQQVDLHLHVVSDGVEAMAFLRKEGVFESAPRPDLVLLDLNMPRKDGREVLLEMKTDRALRSIPVVVLTSSSADADVRRAYELHANCYVAKPTDFAEFRDVLRKVEGFWFHLVRLPPK